MKTLVLLSLLASASLTSCFGKEEDPAPKAPVTHSVTVRYNGQRLEGMRARVRVTTGVVNAANRTQLLFVEPAASVNGSDTFTVSEKDYFAATIAFPAVNSGNTTRPHPATSLSVEVLVDGVSRGSVILNQTTVNQMLAQNRFVEATVGVEKW